MVKLQFDTDSGNKFCVETTWPLTSLTNISFFVDDGVSQIDSAMFTRERAIEIVKEILKALEDNTHRVPDALGGGEGNGAN